MNVFIASDGDGDLLARLLLLEDHVPVLVKSFPAVIGRIDLGVLAPACGPSDIGAGETSSASSRPSRSSPWRCWRVFRSSQFFTLSAGQVESIAGFHVGVGQKLTIFTPFDSADDSRSGVRRNLTRSGKIEGADGHQNRQDRCQEEG